MEVKEYFIKQLKSSKSDVKKDDVIKCAEECGIEIKNKRMALTKIVDLIVEEGFYSKLYEYFSEFVTVPFWEVADFYKMSNEQIKRLKDIGVIQEEPITKEFYSRAEKSYFKADTYKLSIFNYNKEQLEIAYNNAYGGDMYSLRIETNTMEEVEKLINILNRTFKVEYKPKTYSHRNERGYYTYIKVKPLNYSKEEENKLLNKIQQLEEEKKKMEELHHQKIEQIYKILGKYLGDNLALGNLNVKLNKFSKGIEIKKNTRGAGRKPKFDKNKIMEMEIMKENGYSYNEIAKEYNTTKATVIKYLKHKKYR